MARESRRKFRWRRSSRSLRPATSSSPARMQRAGISTTTPSTPISGPKRQSSLKRIGMANLDLIRRPGVPARGRHCRKYVWEALCLISVRSCFGSLWTSGTAKSKSRPSHNALIYYNVCFCVLIRFIVLCISVVLWFYHNMSIYLKFRNKCSDDAAMAAAGMCHLYANMRQHPFSRR